MTKQPVVLGLAAVAGLAMSLGSAAAGPNVPAAPRPPAPPAPPTPPAPPAPGSGNGTWIDVNDGNSATVVGSGTSKSEARKLAAFDKIELAGAVDVEVELGKVASLTVTADDNLLGKITTTVAKGTLAIDTTGSWRSKIRPHVTIVMPALTAVELTGSGDVDVDQLAGGSLAVSIEGSGDVALAGKLDKLALSVSGSGEVDGGKLTAQTAAIEVSGSGDAEVRVAKSVVIDVSGSADVKIHGKPKVQKSVSGSGDVEVIDD